MSSESVDSIEKQIGKVVLFEKRKLSLGKSKPLFWSIASGKGGVGRSFITSSLGITLSRMGYRVLMVDCDLNGGALHSWLGVYHKGKSITDYFSNVDELNQYYTSVGFEKLCLLPGETCSWNSSDENVRDVSDLMMDLQLQPFDIVLFDLSSGLNKKSHEILKFSDEIFLITTPEPSSIEKNYRWIENYILEIALPELDRKTLCEFNKMRKERSHFEKSLFEVRNFLESLQTKNGKGGKLFGPLKIIINQSRNFEDEKLGDSIKSICNKFYFTELHPIGSLQYDNAVWQSGRQRTSVITHQPFNPLVGQIQNLVKQLVDLSPQKAVL